jgi:7-keto-8-aminopelargonate synthetase-like enzyme
MYPAVEEPMARLRFFVTSEHTEAQIRKTAEVLGEELAVLGCLGTEPAAGAA